jgi:hypothetical protein
MAQYFEGDGFDIIGHDVTSMLQKSMGACCEAEGQRGAWRSAALYVS